MPDEQKPGADAPPPQTPNPTGTTPASGGEWKMEDLPASTQQYIKELREEAKKTRLEKDAAEKARKDAEQQQLVEQGNWRKLAEDRAAELAKLTPYQERATALEKIINDNNAQMVEQIPEQMRGIVPPLAPDALNAWLVKNLPLLSRKPAPDTDAGAGQGGGDKTAVLTDDEKRTADLMGISYEKFAKQKGKT
jgi:phage I-like protein